MGKKHKHKRPKKSCCAKPLRKMCKRCPRRRLAEPEQRAWRGQGSR